MVNCGVGGIVAVVAFRVERAKGDTADFKLLNAGILMALMNSRWSEMSMYMWYMLEMSGHCNIPIAQQSAYVNRS